MAGAKVIDKDAKEEIPPHEAGREVLSYVQQQEKEADDIFNEMHGIDPEEEKKPAGAEKEEKAAEAEPGKEEKEAGAKEAETKEPEKKEAEAGKEAETKEPEKKEAEAGKEEKKEASSEEDLTKGLNTENASARISAAQNKMHDSNKRANTAEGEAKRLQEEKETLLKKLEEKAAEAPAKTEAAADVGKEDKKPEPSDDELETSLKELELEYPEIAKPMLKMMARSNAENKKLEEKVEALTVKDKARDEDVKTTKENAHYIAIAEVHSDFDEISKEPLLDEWIDGLPAIEKAGAQAIRKNGSTEDVIELLTSFKKANGYDLPTKEEKEETPAKNGDSKIEKAKKAGNPSFNKAKDVNIKDGEILFTRQQIDNMTQEEYNKNESAIDDAMSKGLIR